ncbi:phosphatase PAP2 family protein [Streptococcus sp. zg-JUN1979]|uniref:phosphatase PAP2 family protein n=1 Tax=Streptococcus sp. zg-JUN1979 TaxID=3391450 RepID=UPI0039A5F9AB
MTDYQRLYHAWTAPFRRYPKLVVILRLVNKSLTYLMYQVYPLFLLHIYLKDGWRSQLLALLLVPAASFLLVSLFRRLYNQPRPYETWDLAPLIIRTSKGKSMPSRHVFSATLISMCVLVSYPHFGACLLFLSLLLAICRVLGGVHYPKDVLIGYMLGIASGALLCLA